jgi:hypothetical protein
MSAETPRTDDAREITSADDATDASPSLADRWALLSPGIRALVIVGALALALVVILDYAWTPARELNEESDRARTTLRSLRESGEDLPVSVQRAARMLGPIDAPRPAAAGMNGLSELVTDVVEQNEGRNFSFELRFGTKLPTSTLTRIVGRAGPGGRIQKVVGTLDFDASPAATTEIVRQLEAHPAIEAISQLYLTRYEDAELVNVRATLEAWVIGRGGTRGGA